MISYNAPGVLYELPLTGLDLRLDAENTIDVSSSLSNGRASYVLFQDLTGFCAGWSPHSEGADSDLALPSGEKAEVKAYYDHEQFTSTAKKYNLIHTAASSTFGPNNKGPQINKLVKAGNYSGALVICRETGFDKNDFYVYTNTKGYSPVVPFRYLVLPRAVVLAGLDDTDPRLISRGYLMSQVWKTVVIPPKVVVAAASAP